MFFRRVYHVAPGVSRLAELAGVAWVVPTLHSRLKRAARFGTARCPDQFRENAIAMLWCVMLKRRCWKMTGIQCLTCLLT